MCVKAFTEVPWGNLSWTARYRWLRGMLSKQRSCGTKCQYTKAAAAKAKAAMEKKVKKTFDIYHCLFCGHYHIGSSVTIDRDTQ